MRVCVVSVCVWGGGGGKEVNSAHWASDKEKMSVNKGGLACTPRSG
jgi:hypothetical protein